MILKWSAGFVLAGLAGAAAIVAWWIYEALTGIGEIWQPEQRNNPYYEDAWG